MGDAHAWQLAAELKSNDRSWLAAAGRMTPAIRYNAAAWHNIFSLNGLGSPYRQFLSERQWIVTAH